MNSPAGFVTKTEVFEGPLELLLALIEKRKLLINEVSLAQVTDDFIAYTKGQGALPLGETAQFIVVASTLLLIKSKSLLPLLEFTEEEQGDMRSLEERLREYKRMRDLSAVIVRLYGASPLYAAQERSWDEVMFAPDRRLSLDLVSSLARGVIAALPKVSVLPKTVVEKVISLEEMIGRLTDRVQRSLKLSFKEFSGLGGTAKKVDVIVSFLAMLELVKQGVVAVAQHAQFGDIAIETDRVGTPRY